MSKLQEGVPAESRALPPSKAADLVVAMEVVVDEIDMLWRLEERWGVGGVVINKLITLRRQLQRLTFYMAVIALILMVIFYGANEADFEAVEVPRLTVSLVGHARRRGKCTHMHV